MKLPSFFLDVVDTTLNIAPSDGPSNPEIKKNHE